jgi:hypothetical protein
MVTGTVHVGGTQQSNILVIQYDNDYEPAECRRHWFANWDRGTSGNDYGLMSEFMPPRRPEYEHFRLMVGGTSTSGSGDLDYTALKFGLDVTCNQVVGKSTAWPPHFIPFYAPGEENLLTGFAAGWLFVPGDPHHFRRFWFTGPSGLGSSFTWRTAQYKDTHD